MKYYYSTASTKILKFPKQYVNAIRENPQLHPNMQNIQANFAGENQPGEKIDYFLLLYEKK